MEMRADVLIVGAGMVGSALALALKDSGLQVLLLDGGPMSVKPFDPQAPFEPRVSALSAASQRILERLDVWPGIAGRRASPYRDMQVWDGSGTGQVHFSAASVHADRREPGGSGRLARTSARLRHGLVGQCAAGADAPFR